MAGGKPQAGCENGIEIGYTEMNDRASLVASGLADMGVTRLIILPFVREKVNIIMAGTR